MFFYVAYFPGTLLCFFASCTCPNLIFQQCPMHCVSKCFSTLCQVGYWSKNILSHVLCRKLPSHIVPCTGRKWFCTHCPKYFVIKCLSILSRVQVSNKFPYLVNVLFILLVAYTFQGVANPFPTLSSVLWFSRHYTSVVCQCFLHVFGV